MRRLALVFAAATLAVPSAAALAASPDPKPGSVRSQFYIFDGSSFEAGAKTPGMEYLNPRQAARFGRLLSLKKDLLAGITHTRAERALK